MIQVTEPFLPPKDEFDFYLKQIWDRNWLTNNGPLVNDLELKLKKNLGINHLLFVTNGTIALQLAIKALNISGEVITTPFSYVATTSSLVWEGCIPRFVDIDKETFNVNPVLIEEAVNEKTSAILATHVYGNPCDVERIELIAKKHRLKVIYDAAHCFGVKYNGKSILTFGDMSTISFHATKVFHTVEGGAIVTNEPELLKSVFYLRNFGHDGPFKFKGVGINGKNSEVHAAMGLCNLKYISQILQKRKDDSWYYDQKLQSLGLRKQKILSNVEYNYSYYPVLFNTEEQLLKAVSELEAHRISPRRYFYPLLSNLEYVDRGTFPVAEDISRRILCLPLSYQMTKSEIDLVCRAVTRSQKY